MKELERVAAALARHSFQLLACAVVAVAAVAVLFGIGRAIAAALLVAGATALATRL